MFIMNMDFFNIFYFILLFMCITAVFSGILQVHKNLRESIRYNLIECIVLRALGYPKKLYIKQYVSYEKYKVWIYFTQPYLKIMF